MTKLQRQTNNKNNALLLYFSRLKLSPDFKLIISTDTLFAVPF